MFSHRVYRNSETGAVVVIAVTDEKIKDYINSDKWVLLMYGKEDICNEFSNLFNPPR